MGLTVDISSLKKIYLETLRSFADSRNPAALKLVERVFENSGYVLDTTKWELQETIGGPVSQMQGTRSILTRDTPSAITCDASNQCKDVNQVAINTTVPVTINGEEATLDCTTQDNCQLTTVEKTVWETEAERIASMIGWDTNNDSNLDLEEIKAGLQAAGLSDIDAGAALQGLQEQIQLRYGPIAANLERLTAELPAIPLIELLRVSINGHFYDANLRAHAFMGELGRRPWQAAPKAAGNLVQLPFNAIGSSARWAWNGVWGDDYKPWSWFPLDGYVANSAEDDRQEGYKALEKLEGAIRAEITREQAAIADDSLTIEGAKAMKGDFQAAFDRLEEEDPEAWNRLEALGIERLYQVAKIENEEEFLVALVGLADEQAPGILGLGGGDFYLARTAYNYLINVANTSSSLTLKKLADRARVASDESNGSGGGFTNMFAAMLCFNGALCDDHFESWGHESKIQIPGRVLEIAIVARLSFKLWRAVRIDIGAIRQAGLVRNGEAWRTMAGKWLETGVADGVRLARLKRAWELASLRNLGVPGRVAEAIKPIAAAAAKATPPQAGIFSRAWEATRIPGLYRQAKTWLGSTRLVQGIKKVFEWPKTQLTQPQLAALAKAKEKLFQGLRFVFVDGFVTLFAVKEVDEGFKPIFDYKDQNDPRFDPSARWKDPTSPDPVVDK